MVRKSVVPSPVMSPGNSVEMQFLGPDIELRTVGMGLKFENHYFRLTELMACMLNCIKLVSSF